MDFLANVNLGGLGELQNANIQNLAAAPSTNLKKGRIYFSTADNTVYVYNGTTWLNALAQGTTYTNGAGINITNNQISISLATGDNAGNVTLTTTNGLAANVASATTSNLGIIEIATDSEATAGTATNLAVTPKQLATKVAKLTTAPTAGAFTKVTINADGLVTSGSTLASSDVTTALGFTPYNSTNPNGYQANVIETVKVNGSALTPSKKAVDITVPTKISDLTDDTATNPVDKADTLTGLTATISELNYVDGVTSAIQTQLNNKLATKPDGTNNIIDSNNKITTSYLPDVVLGQMLYAGTFAPSTAVATLSTNAKIKLGTTSNTITLTNNTTAITGYVANEGCYYICSADGTFASISFVTGDWLVSTGSAWKKIDNTDAVTGVKGNAESTYRIGNVNITADNVLPTQTSNSGKFLTTDGTNCSWATVDALPSQTSQSGKFLTTNGTTASWANAVTPTGTQTLTNKTIDADDNTITDLTTSNFKSGVLQTTVRDVLSASDTALASEKAIATAISTKAIKLTANNTALTPSSGVCTWIITNSIGSADLLVGIYEISTNAQVFAGVIVTSSTITIKMNSSSTIAADTYKMVAIGI